LKRLPLILALILLIGGCSIARKEEPVWFPAKVTRISKEYANINTNIAEPQLSEHGILQGVLFNVRFKDRIVAPRMAKTYTDVDRGRWVALIDDGKLQIAISFGHAATDISCKEGDVVYIQSQK